MTPERYKQLQDWWRQLQSWGNHGSNLLFDKYVENENALDSAKQEAATLRAQLDAAKRRVEAAERESREALADKARLDKIERGECRIPCRSRWHGKWEFAPWDEIPCYETFRAAIDAGSAVDERSEAKEVQW